MRINTNITSNHAARMMDRANTIAGNSAKKVSSGRRINSSADDAAGLSISEKMRGQIRGLGQAIRNIATAQNLFEVGDGALQEICDMLDRAKELAVQAASDIYTPQERAYNEREFQSLLSEIQETVDKSEFNTFKILNGSSVYNRYSVTTRTTTDILKNLLLSNHTMESSTAKSTLSNAAPTQTLTEFTISGSTNKTIGLIVDNYITAIDPTFHDFVRNGLYDSNGNISNANMNRFMSTLEKALDDGFKANGITSDVVADIIDDPNDPNYGKMVFGLTGGDYITYMTCSNITTGSIGHYFMHSMFTPSSQSLDLSVSTTTVVDKSTWDHDIKNLWVQSGANQGQGNMFSWKSITMKQMDLLEATLATREEASKTIGSINTAKKHVLGVRAEFGAFINRLEYASSNVASSELNLTQSESRIRDIDIAKEMSEFLKGTILLNAATAMLAQSNHNTDMVLQLLG